MQKGISRDRAEALVTGSQRWWRGCAVDQSSAVKRAELLILAAT